MPKSVGDLAHIDSILNLFTNSIENKSPITLDFSNVEQIYPEGLAMLACFFDQCKERQLKVEVKSVKKQIRKHTVIQNLINFQNYQTLPSAKIHNEHGETVLLEGAELSLNIGFLEMMALRFSKVFAENEGLEYNCRLILNELMTNSRDHSGAERYYMYAGLVDSNFLVGVLDMGVSIPTKLEAKYNCEGDTDYIEKAFELGVSTRRTREGGLGLNHTFNLVKNAEGRVSVTSRFGHLKRYFKSKRITRRKTKHKLNGTWVFVRFSAKGA